SGRSFDDGGFTPPSVSVIAPLPRQAAAQRVGPLTPFLGHSPDPHWGHRFWYRGNGRFLTTLFITRVELGGWTSGGVARRLSWPSWEGGQVGGDDAQKVARLTEEPLGLPGMWGMAATACAIASTVARSPAVDHLTDCGCVRFQWRRAVTIQARELNQTPSSLRCAASVSRRRWTACVAAA